MLFGGQDRLSIFGDHWAYRPKTGDWIQLARGPSARCHHSIGLDPAAGHLYMFGGFAFTGRLNDLWRYDIARDEWVLLHDGRRSPAPTVRCLQVSVFDPPTGRFILHGGTTGSGFRKSEIFGDTWVFTVAAATWEKLDRGGPSPRYGHRAVLDETRRRMLVYGGFDLDQTFAELWSLNLDTLRWSRTEAGGPGPAARQSPVFVIIPDRDEVLLYGGGDFDSARGDAWILDLTGPSWHQVSAPGPPPRWRAGAAYDPARRRVIVFGGSVGEQAALGDLWAFDVDSQTWSRLP